MGGDGCRHPESALCIARGSAPWPDPGPQQRRPGFGLLHCASPQHPVAPTRSTFHSWELYHHPCESRPPVCLRPVAKRRVWASTTPVLCLTVSQGLTQSWTPGRLPSCFRTEDTNDHTHYSGPWVPGTKRVTCTISLKAGGGGTVWPDQHRGVRRGPGARHWALGSMPAWLHCRSW